MKLTMAIMALFCCGMAAEASAAIKTVGSGKTLQFESSRFPPQMKANHEIMSQKCIKCHTMERIVLAIETGVSPMTGFPFDRNAAKSYGAKMMRKSNSGMTKDEIKACVDLMNYLLDEASR